MPKPSAPVPAPKGSSYKLRLAVRFLARGNLSSLFKELLATVGGPVPSDYQRWRELHRITRRDRQRIRRQIATWNLRPKISLVSPSGPTDLNQLYPPHEVVQTLEDSTGDFVCFIDAQDRLAEQALFRVAEALVAHPTIDVIYSDEDTLSDSDEHGLPFFKPDWSPEYFLAWPYVGRLAVYRRSLVQKVGGIREEFASAWEADLLLRLVAAGAKIQHIPDVLYHRRASAADPHEIIRADDFRQALRDHFDSAHQAATIESGLAPCLTRVRHVIHDLPMVSIVIPSACRAVTFRDRPSWFVLECVASIRRLSTYKNIEIIVVDNNDMSPELAAALQPLDVRNISFTETFNLTRKINLGASHARGPQLLLLNDDIEVITPDWIEALLEFSQQPDIGAVGAMLLFPDGAQQHTGVVIQDGNPRHPFYRANGEHPGYFHSSQVHRNFSAVTGACTMTRTELFNAVGGYSERFPLSYNDIDYCLKILELGKRIVYTPHARLYHHESVSRPLTRPDHVNAFKQFWSPRFPRDPFYNPNLDRHFRIRLK